MYMQAIEVYRQKASNAFEGLNINIQFIEVLKETKAAKKEAYIYLK